ncbi:Txe/YoeB family addiction module toxin [Endozoicomonas sp. 4G]|uniref:Txe/YoeB family addiction module toxin n=1 Tax=Endozoicomonas sp. 4G TaxID=2872754 RepID=UPI0023EEA05D|nr:Txe/YoeB family addiction module toxin [Endozoicomonas sp. 4G]
MAISQVRRISVRSLVFEGNTWQVYEALREKDKKLHKVLCRQLKEMMRGDPTTGVGKPEPLKHGLSGHWSRRLTQKDRLIYRFDDQFIYICALGGHYDQH